MTEKELKKLSRRELLEMLILQTRRVEELEADINELNDKLQARELSVKNADSIAEASLKISGVFEDADSAAQIYLENVKKLSGEGEDLSKQLEEEGREKALRLLRDTELLCREREQRADEYCENAFRKLEQFLNAHEGLKDMLNIKTEYK